MIRFAQFAYDESLLDSPQHDGKIYVLLDGVIREAMPCFQVGEYYPISKKFISLFKDYLGVWVSETENNHLIYLGFGWKNVDVTDATSFPYRWMQIQNDENPSFNALYPYLKFKVSDSWLWFKSDGGGFNHANAKNSYICLKNTITGAEASIYQDGLYFVDRIYETDLDKQETEIRNEFVISKSKIFLKDRRKNQIELDSLGIKISDSNNNFIKLHSKDKFIELYNRISSDPLKYCQVKLSPSGVLITDGSTDTNLNYLELTESGVTLRDRFFSLFETTENGILINFNKNSSDLKLELTETSFKIQYKNNVLEFTDDGLKYNGKYLVSENLVSWIQSNASAFGQGNLGAPVPLFASALSQFMDKVNAGTSSTSFYSKQS